jgi:hypothetical protein
MRVFIVVAASVLAACTMSVSAGDNPTASSCQAEARETWNAEGGAYSIEASSAGPDCAHAVATIVIRKTENAVLWADAHVVEHTFGLNEATDTAAMRTALAEWIGGNTTILRTSALPEWPANASEPPEGEFPFYREPEWNDREGYEALRMRDAPVFCYVQGMESMACLALQDGGLHKIGVQSFPG